MSYCRSNGEDSDVYMIGTGNCLNCMGAGWAKEKEAPVHKRFMADSWETVDANGVVVDSEVWMAKMPALSNEAAMVAWRKEFQAAHPEPLEMRKSGKQHESHDHFNTTSRLEMIGHLLDHRNAGHMVPDYAIDQLRQEIEEDGDLYA